MNIGRLLNKLVLVGCTTGDVDGRTRSDGQGHPCRRRTLLRWACPTAWPASIVPQRCWLVQAGVAACGLLPRRRLGRTRGRRSSAPGTGSAATPTPALPDRSRTRLQELSSLVAPRPARSGASVLKRRKVCERGPSRRSVALATGTCRHGQHFPRHYRSSVKPWMPGSEPDLSLMLTVRQRVTLAARSGLLQVPACEQSESRVSQNLYGRRRNDPGPGGHCAKFV